MKPTFALVLAIFATSGLSGCGNSTDSSSTGGNVAQRNPASVFCAEQGGENDLVNGDCRLRDGTVVDAWEYYREHHPDATEE